MVFQLFWGIFKGCLFHEKKSIKSINIYLLSTFKNNTSWPKCCACLKNTQQTLLNTKQWLNIQHCSVWIPYVILHILSPFIVIAQHILRNGFEMI